MTQKVLSPATIRNLTETTEKVLSAIQDPVNVDMLRMFKADPLQVITQFGGQTSTMDKDMQRELSHSLRQLKIPDASAPHLLGAVGWRCIGCEAGLNVVIVAAGGIAAILIAVAAGPEILAGSAVVLAIVEFTGLAASVVAEIIIGVAAGDVVVALEAIVAALCEATGACG